MKKRPRLVLHMGTHKTGTTSQQANLARDRAWLVGQGVAYPDLSIYDGFREKAAHNTLIAHLVESDVPSSSALRFRDDLLRKSTECNLILLSAEQIWRRTIGFQADISDPDDSSWRDARVRFLERLAEYLDPFDVVPLLWFRNVSDYAQSMVKEGQFLGGGLSSSVEDYVQLRAERFAYDVQLDLIEAVFGPADVRHFQDAVHQGVYPAMLSALGVTDRPEREPIYMRRSPTNRASLWFARHTGGKRPAKSLQRAAHSFAVSEVGQRALSGPKTTLWRTQESYRAFSERFRSLRVPETNTDPDMALTILPWQHDDHARAEQAFAIWLSSHCPS